MISTPPVAMIKVWFIRPNELLPIVPNPLICAQLFVNTSLAAAPVIMPPCKITLPLPARVTLEPLRSSFEPLLILIRDWSGRGPKLVTASVDWLSRVMAPPLSFRFVTVKDEPYAKFNRAAKARVRLDEARVKDWPFHRSKTPSMLDRFANPFFDPALIVPISWIPEPLDMSVIPLGWLVRFRVDPW